MNIRPMRPSDYPQVDRLMGRLHALHVCGRSHVNMDMAHVYSKEKFLEMIADASVIALLAEEDEQTIGLCFAHIRNRTCMVNMKSAYMDDLIVDENFRHRGVARRLFEETEKHARDLGAERLDLMVWSFNEDALAFYGAMGMTPQRYIFEKKL